MDKSLEKLAIVILNYNSADLSIHAADIILKHNTGTIIILVDNCSSDDSKKVLQLKYKQEERVYLVFSDKNSGYASGNNLGVKEAEKLSSEIDTILIMNPDIELSDIEVLFQMYEKLHSNQKIGALTVKTMFNGEIREPNECAWRFLSSRFMILGGTIIGRNRIHPGYYSEYHTDSDGVAYVDVVQGCFFMIRLEVLKQAGYFDENTFLYSEESILAKRLKQYNLVNAVLPGFYIKHNHKEKKEALQKYKNKVFDMNCYYNSRKYYIENYSGKSHLFILISKVFLTFDLSLKKMIYRLKLKN